MKNGFKANPDKFHLILHNLDEKYFIKIQNFQIFKSKCKELLGIKIDCSLTCMEHALSRVAKLLNTKKRHERAICLVYDDNVSSFEKLLNKDNSFTIHERNIQTLAIGLYKVFNKISPVLMTQVFPLKDHPNTVQNIFVQHVMYVQ